MKELTLKVWIWHPFFYLQCTSKAVSCLWSSFYKSASKRLQTGQGRVTIKNIRKSEKWSHFRLVNCMFFFFFFWSAIRKIGFSDKISVVFVSFHNIIGIVYLWYCGRKFGTGQTAAMQEIHHKHIAGHCNTCSSEQEIVRKTPLTFCGKINQVRSVRRLWSFYWDWPFHLLLLTGCL